MKAAKPKLRKITVMLPADLLDRATKISGEGITPTLRKGLETFVQADAFDRVLAMHGAMKLDPKFFEELRRDER